MIKDFLDSIQQRIVDAFSGVLELAYLAGWYGIGVALLLGTLALSWFFGGLPVVGKWIRGIGGIAVLLFGAFLAGLQVMYNHSKADNQAYREKIKELQTAQRKRDGNSGWFS